MLLQQIDRADYMLQICGDLDGVGGSIYTSNTLRHLQELAFDSQRAHKNALKFHAQTVHCAHKLTNVHLKRLIALKISVWSRGLPATLQIPTSFLFPLVEETHGTSGQCLLFLN